MRTFLLTGGTGSLGTALTLKLLSEGHRVRALARNEHGHERLHDLVPFEHRTRLSNLVGDVRDAERVRLAADGCDTIIHAAAMKIVGRCEYDPVEAVKTNVVGSINVAAVAREVPSVTKAVFVSSDKSPAPANAYAATKMLGERVWLASNRYLGAHDGKFVAVRYGNVWGSAGSVVHAFAHQRKSGRLMLTHKSMTRFHIRMETAVEFILRVVREAKPGELWMPKMPSYALVDLAAVMAPGMPHEVIGIRPGEKIHETIIAKPESYCVERRDGHFVLNPSAPTNDGEWEYTSGSNTWKLTREELAEEVRHYERDIAPLYEVRRVQTA